MGFYYNVCMIFCEYFFFNNNNANEQNVHWTSTHLILLIFIRNILHIIHCNVLFIINKKKYTALWIVHGLHGLNESVPLEIYIYIFISFATFQATFYKRLLEQTSYNWILPICKWTINGHIGHIQLKPNICGGKTIS